MNRYIDADRLKKHFEWWEGEAKAKEFKEIFDEIIDAQPTADVVERKRGKWFPIFAGEEGYSAGDFRCSVCGKPNKCYGLTKYCANCGAQMEADDGEI